MSNTQTKLLIVGGGPAGLTAAIYAARAGLAPHVLMGYQPGGQLMTTTLVENYPGFADGVQGPELMAAFIKQAERFGAQLHYTEAASVDFSEDTKKVTDTEGVVFEAAAVILATGAAPRRLNVPGEQEYWARGVSTCATCDGFLFRGKEVAVIGGGDTAMEEALFLTNHATKVYVVHRRDQFRASKVMADRVLAHPKVEVIWNTEVREVSGDENLVNRLNLWNSVSRSESELAVQGMFLAIGHDPVVGYLNGAVKLRENGYVDSPDGVQTSVAGVFVAGDVEDYIYRQAVTAAGMGCAAALSAQKYLETH